MDNTNNSISEYVNRFYDYIKKDPQHRWKSWEHCYKYFFFNKYRLTEPEVLDTASLHLSFYLASWGMYRGSTALLWKDYTLQKDLLKNLVYYIMNDDIKGMIPCIYDFYSKQEFHRVKNEDINSDDDIATVTVNYIPKKNKSETGFITPSKTLISKILLGINGSCVAFDKNVQKGIGNEDFVPQKISDIYEKIGKLETFYETNLDEFSKCQLYIDCSSIKIPYPPMKLLDMYFFQKGIENNK